MSLNRNHEMCIQYTHRESSTDLQIMEWKKESNINYINVDLTFKVYKCFNDLLYLFYWMNMGEISIETINYGKDEYRG